MQLFGSVGEVTASFSSPRLINAEFMYRPRPAESRDQIVFDYALKSRLAALGSQDTVLFIADSQKTINSLTVFEATFPHLRMAAIITNPSPMQTDSPTSTSPHLLKWEEPNRWRQYQITDRWARIDAALEIGSLMQSSGYLIMPAHDTVWGKDLLSRLLHFSQRYPSNGLPAAVSPYTYHQHSPVPGANIPPDIIDLLNTTFRRDTLFRWKIRFDQVQAFWGKMGMVPFGMCGTVRSASEKTTWEDDLEIDRVIRESGYGVRCLWVSDLALYRQSPPIFDRDRARKVIERTLHYSLHIPDERIGGSTLNFPLDTLGRLRSLLNPKFARLNKQAEALIAECCAEIAGRLKEFGASWVDWGDYRYVTRVGNPVVEVWKCESSDLTESSHSN